MILSSTPIALFDFLGGGELLVIFLLVLVFFGGEKMPEVARGVAKAIRELRKATSGVEQEFRKVLEEDPVKPAHSPAPLGTTPTIMPPSVPTDAASTAPRYSEEGILHEDQYAAPEPAGEPAASTPVQPAAAPSERAAPAPSQPAVAPENAPKPDVSGSDKRT